MNRRNAIALGPVSYPQCDYISKFCKKKTLKRLTLVKMFYKFRIYICPILNQECSYLVMRSSYIPLSLVSGRS